MNAPQAAHAPPLRRLVRYARPHRRSALIAGGWSVANKLFDIAPELLIGVAIDVVVRGQESVRRRALRRRRTARRQLLVLAAITAFVWIAESVTQYLAAHRLAQPLADDPARPAHGRLRARAGARARRWFEDRASGELLTVLNDDVNQLERFLDVGATRSSLTVDERRAASASSSSSSRRCWRCSRSCRSRSSSRARSSSSAGSSPRYAAVRDEAGALSGLIGGNLGGIATIKAFGAEAREAGARRARLHRPTATPTATRSR